MSLVCISNFWKISSVNKKAEIMRTLRVADICIDRRNIAYNSKPYNGIYGILISVISIISNN